MARLRPPRPAVTSSKPRWRRACLQGRAIGSVTTTDADGPSHEESAAAALVEVCSFPSKPGGLDTEGPHRSPTSDTRAHMRVLRP